MKHPAIRWFRVCPGTRPLVLIHGFTGSHDSWDAVVAGLPGDRSVASVSLPGHDPAVPVSPRGFAANVDAMAGILAGPGAGHPSLAGAHVCGYSLGARAALGMVARHPGLAARLTLIGVHPGLASARERDARIVADQRVVALLRTGGIAAFVAAWRKLPIFASQAGLPAAVRARQERIRMSHDPDALAMSLEAMGLGVMPDFRRELAALVMPACVITGALDHKFTALAREITTLAPGIDHRVIPDCGHNPTIERPDVLAAMLAELDRES